MKLDERVLTLIAVGASIGANCQPCLQNSVRMALDCGADEQEIAEAIAVGKKVRQCAASNMDSFVMSFKSAAFASMGATSGEHECDSLDTIPGGS